LSGVRNSWLMFARNWLLSVSSSRSCSLVREISSSRRAFWMTAVSVPDAPSSRRRSLSSKAAGRELSTVSTATTCSPERHGLAPVADARLRLVAVLARQEERHRLAATHFAQHHLGNPGQRLAQVGGGNRRPRDVEQEAKLLGAPLRLLQQFGVADLHGDVGG